jgi:hypothetical protein
LDEQQDPTHNREKDKKVVGSLAADVVPGQTIEIAMLTREVNNTANQNSLRRALPLNVAYFEKKLEMAAPNDMGSLTFGVLLL